MLNMTARPVTTGRAKTRSVENRARRPALCVRGSASLVLVLACVSAAPPDANAEYRGRVAQVTQTRGFVVLWDFVKRDAGTGRFDAYKAKGGTADFRLDALNYVRDYWGEGRPATYADIPLLGRGPFGQAIEIRAETDPAFRPCLIVPRNRLHDSGLDVKGPGRSVSMVAWVVRRTGNHAIAGIWHEGTDLAEAGKVASRVEKGMRQYALFAGLGANEGASAVHVSDNGAKSFGDKYARNLAVTPEKLKTAPANPSAADIDSAWSVMAFVFDNPRNTVTAYLDGRATEYWIDNPQRHGFFKWPANGWLQAELRRAPGLQEGEDPSFPEAQFYTPPETKVLKREVIERSAARRVELLTYEFTKVRVTMDKDGSQWRQTRRELVALKVNPFWFGHDLYAPASIQDGGPFTIGRVIHSGRTVGFTGWIGGVAVFGSALSAKEIWRLSRIGFDATAKSGGPRLLCAAGIGQ